MTRVDMCVVFILERVVAGPHTYIQHTSQPESFFLHLPMKMEPIEGSETSAFKTQTPGKYPKENIQV
jgi:hypothetical protein